MDAALAKPCTLRGKPRVGGGIILQVSKIYQKFIRIVTNSFFEEFRSIMLLIY